MKLLKHANVYTPAPLGKRDVLIEGERILRIAEEITGYDELPDVDVYDLSGKTLVPAECIRSIIVCANKHERAY